MAEWGEEGIPKEHVIKVYVDLTLFLKTDEFGPDLRLELEKAFPGYLQVLERRRKDMDKSDHGIVIAGETSAGKSSLINKILGKNIFKGRNRPSTSTFCKLRNCERTRVIVEYASGEREEKLGGECDIETKEGRKTMRETLEKLTDMKKCSENEELRCVDIGFPIPILQKNTILVDTPGVGGSDDQTKRVIEYLSNALSFIFVIDVGSSGGMLSDRLPVILTSLIDLLIDDEMPCFDPSDVIFITNKWDTLKKIVNASSDDSEDEETQTWLEITSDIKDMWKQVKDENIFKLNLTDVSPGNGLPSTAQFEKFQKVLLANIRKAENVRVVKHVSFLSEILDQLSGMIDERCRWNKFSEEQKKDLADKKEETLRKARRNFGEFSDTFETMTEELETDIANSIRQYMSTDEGKEKILNPKGRTPILKYQFYKNDTYIKEIISRVSKYVKGVMEGDAFVSKNREIQKKVILFYTQTCKELGENDITDVPSYTSETYSAKAAEPEAGKYWYLVPIAMITLAQAVLGIALAGVWVATFWSPEATRKEIIDKVYNQCKEETLKKVSCYYLRKKINKVMNDMLTRRLNSFEERARQLREKHKEVLAQQKLLLRLDAQVRPLKKRVLEMQEYVNTIG